MRFIIFDNTSAEIVPAIRFPDKEREMFIKKYKAKLNGGYDIIRKEYFYRRICSTTIFESIAAPISYIFMCYTPMLDNFTLHCFRYF